jgi:hypothetical protein
MVLDRLGRGGRCFVVPELLDEPVGRDGLARVQEQEREQCPLPAAAEGDVPVAVTHLERSEDPEIHVRRL